MVVVDVKGDEFYLDGYLFENLELAKGKVRDDWDFVMVVDGTERGGKSTLAQQIAKFVYPDFSIDDIVFNEKQFRDRVMVAKPFSAIVYDEAYGGLGSRSSMSSVNKVLVQMLTEIGFKNLFIIVVLPSVFDVDRYVALWRARALFHIYTGDKWERGFFSCYNRDRLKDLYMRGKKFYDYGAVKPNFYGRFVKHYCVDKDAYVSKKREAQEVRENDKKGKVGGDFKEALYDWVMGREDLSHSERIRLLGMPESTYFVRLRKLKTESY